MTTFCACPSDTTTASAVFGATVANRSPRAALPVFPPRGAPARERVAVGLRRDRLLRARAERQHAAGRPRDRHHGGRPHHRTP